MKFVRKLFGGIRMTWVKLIIFAVAAGIWTGVMAMLPAAKDTSFADISIYFEWWILFGIVIIMNSRSPLDSGLKCFVFFLISQPLVYLTQIVAGQAGVSLFTYYRYWFMVTLLTLPMGYIGFFMKKDKWWGILILAPMLVLLAVHAHMYFGEALYWFPRHLLSGLFCIAVMFITVPGIFRDRKARILGLTLDAVLVAAVAFFVLTRPVVYDTVLICSNGSEGVTFDDSCEVSLKDPSFGEVKVEYDGGLEDYLVRTVFKKAGHTEFTIETVDGDMRTFAVDIRRHDYDLTEVTGS